MIKYPFAGLDAGAEMHIGKGRLFESGNVIVVGNLFRAGRKDVGGERGSMSSLSSGPWSGNAGDGNV